MANIILYSNISTNDGTDIPTASAEYRGIILIEKGDTDVADAVKICVKIADNTYTWKTINLS